MTTFRDQENSNSVTPTAAEPSVNSTPENSERRKFIKKIAVGTAAVAGCSALPSKWTSPIVEFGALPAHAVTSGAEAPAAQEAPAAPAEEPASSGDTQENGKYHGRYNGNRPTWYYSKRMSSYPKTFKCVISGCASTTVSNNGSRYVGGGIIAKQSDVPGRGMAVIGAPSCGSRTSYIVY